MKKKEEIKGYDVAKSTRARNMVVRLKARCLGWNNKKKTPRKAHSSDGDER